MKKLFIFLIIILIIPFFLSTNISNYNLNSISGQLDNESWVILTSDGVTQQKGKLYKLLPAGNFNINVNEMDIENELIYDDVWYWVGVWDKTTNNWITGLDPNNPQATGIWFQKETIINNSISVNYAPGNEIKALDMKNDPTGNYAYAPSIMYYDNKYHLWACSNNSSAFQDVISYTTSIDGINWTPREIVLSLPTNAINNGYDFTCDPSVIQHTPKNGKKYFYLFFTAQKCPYGSLNSVARSENPNGPFKIYKGGDPSIETNWNSNNSNKIGIINYPKNNCDSQCGLQCYGAGQPTTLELNNEIYQWYSDTTVDNQTSTNNILFTKSTNGVNWSTPSTTNIPQNFHSVTVKYIPEIQTFLMIGINNRHFPNSELKYFYSTDGINWTINQVTNGTHTTFPNDAHNPGISGDEKGFLLENTTMGFGAPYNLTEPDEFGYWDLFTNYLIIKHQKSPRIDLSSCSKGFEGYVSKPTWIILNSYGPSTSSFDNSLFYRLEKGNFSISLTDFDKKGTLDHSDEWYWVGLWDSEIQNWTPYIDSNNITQKGIWIKDNCNNEIANQICTQFVERFTTNQWLTHKTNWKKGTHTLLEIIRRAKLWKYCN
jgi:hypothetical protein